MHSLSLEVPLDEDDGEDVGPSVGWIEGDPDGASLGAPEGDAGMDGRGPRSSVESHVTVGRSRKSSTLWTDV
jgi:hypothetical protein